MSVGQDTRAALAVSAALEACPVAERAALLRQMMARCAQGIGVIEGEIAAAEATYQLADVLVARCDQ